MAPPILNFRARWREVVNITPQPLYPFTPGERTPVPTKQETGWDPELIWMFWRREKSLDPARIQTPDRPAQSSYYINYIYIQSNSWVMGVTVDDFLDLCDKKNSHQHGSYFQWL